MAHLATVSEIPQVGPFPIKECADPVLASWSRVSFCAVVLVAGTHIGCTMLCTACLCRGCWQSQTGLNLLWKLCVESVLIVV
jgi:hypothetical protein